MSLVGEIEQLCRNAIDVSEKYTILLQEYNFLVSYVGEWPCRPIQSPNNGRKKKVKVKKRGNKIKFIDLGFERWPVVGFGKGRKRHCRAIESKFSFRSGKDTQPQTTVAFLFNIHFHKSIVPH